MLGVTFTSRAVLEDDGFKRKKDKKEKIKKKSKKDKKERKDKKRADSGSEDSSSDDDGGPGSTVPDEGPAGTKTKSDPAAGNGVNHEDAQPAPQREDWMTKPMRREAPKLTEEEQEEQRRKEAAAVAEPEVVAGLRIMKKPDAAGTAAEAAPGAGAGPSGNGTGSGGGGGGALRTSGLVGDGGASWRLKALRRAQEKARAEGRSLHEVVGERYGSLTQLTADLSSAAAADGKAHLRAAAERRRAAAEGLPPPAVLPHYLQDVRSDQAKMLRPSDDASLRWRREARDRDRDKDRDRGGRDGERDRDRGSNPDADREEAGRRRDAERSSGQEEEPREGGAGRDADRDRGRRDELRGRDRNGDGDRTRRDERHGGPERHRDRDRDGDGDRDRDRDRGGDRDRERDTTEGRQGRDGGRDREASRREPDSREGERERREPGGGGREREQERDRRGPPEGGRQPQSWRREPRPSREQAAALQQLAGSLNTFRDDGSFMDRFLASRQQQQRGGKEAEGTGGQQEVRRQGEEEEAEDRQGRPSPLAAGESPDRGDRGDGRPGTATASAGGGGGGTNRAIAAMLRGRGGGGAVAAASESAGTGRPAAGAEPRQQEEAEGGGDDDGRKAEGAATRGREAAPARRAPLFVGQDGDGGEGAGAGARDGGRGQQPPAPATGGGAAPVGNKSAAELLRARLRGLPPPPQAAAVSEAAPAAAAAGRPEAGASGRREEGQQESSGDGDGGSGSGRRREVVQLPLVDAQGRAVKGAFGRESAGAGVAPNAGKRAGTKAPERYNRQTGEKERYFADDDKVDLQTMLRRAKYGDDDMDMDGHLAANIAKKRKFRETDLDADAEYDFDGGVEMYESRGKRGNAEAQRNRDRGRQVADMRRQAAAEAGCLMCLSNPKRNPQLTIALGTSAYLGLPPRGRLLRGHCCISPGEHLPSIRGLDEATWTEVKNFIKCLIRMYGAQGQSVIFMETYMTRGGSRNHAVLDAVPVTERQLEKARGYFKKAILEAESEWSTHHAKACIETTAQKGLRESIPPNFPYFYVQFGYGSGYVHVIDDETKFDPNFGRQVLIGLLDLPPELAFQRQKAESAATQQQWAREFEAMWDPYDWTRQLHEG